MIYGSVCSGIEAATVAWHPLGWQAAWFSEIEKFPCAVLQHHYPNVPNLGDMTADDITSRADAIDLLVGGTPCQSFSVAGLRKGMDDPRGNLSLIYLKLLAILRPRWAVWENVPGVLSSSGGRDFGAFLGGLGQLGYGWAYRVLDAQYFGVPQRRRRVFVVGHLGGWQRAAAVLFERESLLGHPPPRREAGQSVAPTLADGAGGGCNDVNRGVVPTLRANQTTGFESEVIATPWDNQRFRLHETAGVAPTLSSSDGKGGQRTLNVVYPEVAQTLSRRDHKTPPCGRDGIVGNPIVVNARQTPVHASGKDLPLDAKDRGHAVTFQQNTRDEANLIAGDGQTAGALSANEGMKQRNYIAFEPPQMQVRRLTPVECERLQGFPDDHTAIPWRGKPAEECPDGPRYKAIGNSMAVPVMQWIGQRIQDVDRL